MTRRIRQNLPTPAVPAGSAPPDARSPGLSRRQLLQAALIGAGGVALGSALAGCAGPSASAAGKTSVTVWDLFTGSDGANMQKMVGTVAAANPDVSINSVTLAWGPPYYTKLAMASSGGRPPETAIMHMSRLAGYAPGGLLEPFDLDELAKVGIREEDYAPAVWKKAQYDGKLYALPLDTHPYIAFFNPDVVRKAGLDVTGGQIAGLTSADSFLAAGRAMAKATGETGVSFGYLNDTASTWRMFWGLYSQTGGGFDLTPGRSAQLDDKAATDVIAFLQEMLDGTVAARNQDGGAAEGRFMTKRTGLMFSGEWELPTLKGTFPDLGAMPMPTLFGTAATYADSHSFVLPRQKHPDPARRAATYRVLAGIVKQGLTWANAGHIPAYLPIVESPAYQDLAPQKDYAPSAKTAVFDPDVWFTGAGSDFQNRVGGAMTDALSGKASPQKTVDRMLHEMNFFLSQPNPA